MSDKSAVLRAFNVYFSEFFDYMIAAFPEDAALRAAKRSVEALRSASPTIILRVWKNRICAPYAAELAAGDIEFFVSGSARDGARPTEGATAIVEALRAAVAQMGPAGRAGVVAFLQNLSKLADLYPAAST